MPPACHSLPHRHFVTPSHSPCCVLAFTQLRLFLGTHLFDMPITENSGRWHLPLFPCMWGLRKMGMNQQKTPSLIICPPRDARGHPHKKFFKLSIIFFVGLCPVLFNGVSDRQNRWYTGIFSEWIRKQVIAMHCIVLIELATASLMANGFLVDF